MDMTNSARSSHALAESVVNRIVELYIEGWTFGAINKELNISPAFPRIKALRKTDPSIEARQASTAGRKEQRARSESCRNVQSRIKPSGNLRTNGNS